MLAHAPQAVQSQLAGSFGHFLEAIKVAFSGSLSYVYIVSTIMMTAALLAIFFLPEIPLRKGQHVEPKDNGSRH